MSSAEIGQISGEPASLVMSSTLPSLTSLTLSVQPLSLITSWPSVSAASDWLQVRLFCDRSMIGALRPAAAMPQNDGLPFWSLPLMMTDQPVGVCVAATFIVCWMLGMG